MQICMSLYPIITSIGRTPWFIAYDETYDAVVISIRGTWSLKDCITDLLVGTTPYPSSLIRIETT